MLKKYSAIFLLLLLTCLTYSQVVHHEFLNYDDDVFVTANQYVKEGFSPRAIKWALQADLFFDSASADYWQPVTILSRLLDVQLFGLNSSGHHLMNLFYHLLNVFLVLVLIFELSGSFYFAWAVAAVFALHPLQVQTVCWVTARKDLLSALFSLSALIVYVKTKRITLKQQWFISFLLALGIMSKPSAAVVPILMVLIDLIRSKKKMVKISEKIPFFILSVFSFLVLWTARTGVTIDIPKQYQFFNVAFNFREYVSKFLFPVNLYIYSRIPDSELSFLKALLAYALIALFSAWCFQKRKKVPYLFFGWFWFAASILPSIFLTRADRFMYFPLIGLALGIAALFNWKFGSKKLLTLRWLVAVGVVGLLACLAYRESWYWKDNVTLFSRSLALDDRNYRAHNNLASAYSGLGRDDEAITHYTKALEISPYYSQAHHNLAVILARKENFHIAEFHYLRAIETNPSFGLAYSSLGHLYMEVREYAKAVKVYEKSIQIEPDSDITRKAYGNALAAIGELERSCEQYEEALKINPNFPEAHHDWGFVLAKQKRYKEAEAHFMEALRLDPEYADVHNKLGVTFAMQGDYERATYHLEEAIRINPLDKNAIHNLNLVAESKYNKGIVYED